ncbi:MAG: ketose-bisphosphate aldolase [Candidatus Bathyarchaeota archaeon]|nr:MAG: ketose-bisphosphate aldolase [Candidatus Bathyarchaeota archaeon]
MLVTNDQLLSTATNQGYAVGAFNIHNLETLSAIVAASTKEHSPVIVAVTPSTIDYAGLQYLANIVKIAADSVQTPMALHLDHGKDLTMISRCIDAGFTSVMIDGSHLEPEKNIALTKQAVNLAHSRGVSVEGEIGRLAGVEEATVEEKEAILTEPEAAGEFVSRTGVDALAVALGTSHGAYKFKGKPRLDFERLKAIRREVKVHLVLHGASGVPSWVVEKAVTYGAELSEAQGIPDEHVKKAISLGVVKVNIDTDLRLAFVGAVREILASSPSELDPRKVLGAAKEAMEHVIQGKMQLFGSSGKAL